MKQHWWVYIVRCKDSSLYTGLCTDVTRRLHEHNHDNQRAARYTRARRPVKLVYQERCTTRSSASKREHSIKRLSRVQKLALIRQAARRKKN